MIKKAIYLSIIIFVISCGQENITNAENNLDSKNKINNTEISAKSTSESLKNYYKSAVPQMVDSLKKRGYKFPSYEVFRNKILEIAHRDIDTASIDRLYAVAGDADAIISERFFTANGTARRWHS